LEIDVRGLDMIIEAQTLDILIKVNRFLNEKRVEAYLVGGFVRDTLIGRSTADIDIAVAADALSLAAQMAENLDGKYVLLDETNRIARVVLFSGPQVENRKQWYVDVSTLNGNIRQDLARRDFRIDALAVRLDEFVRDPLKMRVIDPFDGQIDIKSKLIQSVSPDIFESDPARLLRAVRLAAELDFQIAPATEALIRSSKDLIQRVAGERVRDELLRVLSNRRAGFFIRYLDELGLLTALIPELESSRGVEQPKEHHWDVLSHALETVSTADFILRQSACSYADSQILYGLFWDEKLARYFASEVSAGSTRASLFKLAALLHDIAKPETRIIYNDRIRFFGHTELGAEAVTGILERLRFSNKEIRLVELMVRYHMRPTQMSNEGMPSRRAIYKFFRDAGSAGVDILFLSLADHLAARGPGLDSIQWKGHIDQVNYILAEYFRQAEKVVLARLLDGHDLIRIFGLKPGPEIREILEDIKEAQVAGEINTRDEALSYAKNRILYREQK
jgi:poly(A) polymerase